MNEIKSFIWTLFFLGLILNSSIVFSQNEKSLITVDKVTKRIIYSPYTPQGDIIPDFSFCGYKGGGVNIDIPKVVKILKPLDGDNTLLIQNALDSVGQLPLNKDGLRGAILLTAGEYKIAKTLKINYSGITLMGEKSKAKETILIATTPKQYTLIEVGEPENANVDNQSKRQVIADYVPSGTKKLLLDDVSPFKVGDAIIVERPSTAEWISFIGMDKIESIWLPVAELSKAYFDRYETAGKISEDKKKYDATEQWMPGSKNLKFERTITAIKGKTITLNIPITNALQKEFGGAIVYKYKYFKRLTEVGIANLSATSLFNNSVTDKSKGNTSYFADEQHGWTCVEFVNAENSWVDNVESKVFSFGFVCGVKSRFITIQNSSFLEPVSLIFGGRRYAYLINGQQCLVYNCYSSNARHDFIMGAVVAGPNAFLDNKAELCHNFSEPHQRWATGTLFENCSVSGPDAAFSLSNRGSWGSGHGWSGAQMVLWNCITPLAVIMKPPTGQNFSFGTIKLKDQWSSDQSIQNRLNKLNVVSNQNFKYTGPPSVGDGYIFSDGENIMPKSLYFQQLKERKSK
jgi:hypothetical protein